VAGTARTSGSQGENITHFNAIRMRIQGSGNLKMSMISQDEIITKSMVDLPLKEANNIQPTRLTNFMQQRAIFELHTEKRLDFFRINRIILFTKETFSSYPG
jgi:hypothetical protein